MEPVKLPSFLPKFKAKRKHPIINQIQVPQSYVAIRAKMPGRVTLLVEPTKTSELTQIFHRSGDYEVYKLDITQPRIRRRNQSHEKLPPIRRRADHKKLSIPLLLHKRATRSFQHIASSPLSGWGTFD